MRYWEKWIYFLNEGCRAGKNRIIVDFFRNQKENKEDQSRVFDSRDREVQLSVILWAVEIVPFGLLIEITVVVVAMNSAISRKR